MEFVPYLIGVALCLWVLWWMLNSDARKLRRFQAEMLARLTVSDREFVARYFRCEQVSSEVAVQVRRIFAEFTELPVQTILPDDDFRAYLLDNEFEMATVLEHAFKLTIPDSDAAKMRATVRSVSIVMAELVRRKQAIERVERQPSRPS